ncbi:trypsin-like peptidase domain-containing protein [Massilia pseudoviolaceinigra]|uniref:trypsin-like peptidase domain-containing protein n=1 Tax=Massilia pseudoviolaceinigra TaxID=3057165 RepID=UPI002796B584|nr:trypsin-like peptidase domain-containing protein [Massilia sp. CCM 9206]MDQ1921762.1 trypsin-like peptidase domain-containing protein [Massilia sp. CCM 9206]
MKRTLYTILGVDPLATSEEIAAAYARLHAAFQSGSYDRNDWVLVREAYAVLSNTDKRAMYDRSQIAPPLTRSVEPAPRQEGFSLDWRYGLAAGLLVAGLVYFAKGRPPAPAPVMATQGANQGANQGATPVLMQDSGARADPFANQPQAVQAPAGGSSGAMGMEELFAKLSPYVARINMYRGGTQTGTGSGVALGGDAIITNCHVALAGTRLQVKLGQDSYEATVAVADEERDLCKLSVKGLNAPAVVIGASSDVRTGQRVIAIGAPHGLDLTISDGIVSSLRPLDGGTLIQTTAPVSPGSSGGGLFDSAGRLVGIVTFQMRTGQNLNFAAPAEWIGSMRTRSGGGLIGKMSAERAQSDPAQSARNGDMVVGQWHCHDTIGGTSVLISFHDDRTLEMRYENRVSPGRWMYRDGQLGIQFANVADTMRMEELSRDKMILKFNVGQRLVCARR